VEAGQPWPDDAPTIIETETQHPEGPHVRFRLTPRETSFYDMFAASADNIVTGSRLLMELLGADSTTRPEIAERMRAAEHAGDDATHAIFHQLNSSFITPFDREDIYSLAGSLDDIMDYMEEAVDLVVLYNIEELPKGVEQQIEVLARAAELTAEAMPNLRTMANLTEYWIEVNRLENQADQIHRKLLAHLFNGKYDAIEVLKLKQIVDVLEEAADAFEHVANTVETIAVKES
jgi:predicted phosphate transport protein (TIGR00153 family)